ncbi:sugar phosphate isomerase/epimerase, partial [Candidatus Bathyarchaeota archaeon]|nr:sugar phosphate isomerase/epimerase [Candidatus Bathyarchaeota archaeon]
NISLKATTDERRKALNLVEQNGVEFSSLATSVQIGEPAEKERRSNMAQAKAYAKLAEDLDSEVIRIFVAGQPGVSTSPEGKTLGLTGDILDRVAEDLCELGDYCDCYGVTPAIEEGHSLKLDGLRLLLDWADTKNAGIIWNRSAMDRESFLLLRGSITSIHAHNDMLDPKNEDIFYTLKLLTPKFKGYVNLEIEHLENPDPNSGLVPRESFEAVIKKFRSGCDTFKLPFW